MTKKAFETVEDGSTVTFDFDRNKSWKVTLGGNRTVVFAGGQEGDEVAVKIIQDGTGSRTLTWDSDIVWPANQPPTLKTAASSVDLFTFKKDASGIWRCTGGSGGERLPSRVTQTSLTTMSVVGAASGLVGLTLALTGGNGQGVGNLPRALEVRSNSGAQLLTQINGTGSLGIGSGTLAVGELPETTTAAFFVANNGSTSIRNTASGYLVQGGGGLAELGTNGAMSGRTLTLDTFGPRVNQIPCFKAGGVIGYYNRTATGTIVGDTCN